MTDTQKIRSFSSCHLTIIIRQICPDKLILLAKSDKILSPVIRMSDRYVNPQKDRMLMDEVRDLMRLQHYAIQTECAYCSTLKTEGRLKADIQPHQRPPR